MATHPDRERMSQRLNQVSSIEDRKQRSERELDRYQNYERDIDQARGNVNDAIAERKSIAAMVHTSFEQWRALHQFLDVLDNDIAEARHGGFKEKRVIGGVEQADQWLSGCFTLSMDAAQMDTVRADIAKGLEMTKKHAKAPAKGSNSIGALKKVMQNGLSTSAEVSYAYTPQSFKETFGGLDLGVGDGSFEVDMPAWLNPLFNGCGQAEAREEEKVHAP